MARYTARAPMVSMDATKTFPASTWRGEPLRKDIAAVPDSNPRLPAQIYGRIGHWPFLEIYTWTGAPVFHRTALKCRSNTWGFWMVSDEEDRAVFRGPPQKGSRCEVRQSSGLGSNFPRGDVSRRF